MNDISQLVEKRKELDAEIAAAMAAGKDSAIAAIREIMAQSGLSYADIRTVGSVKRPAHKLKGLKIVPVFACAETGMSWSGRGKMPLWLTKKIAEGKSVEEFRNHSAQAGSPVQVVPETITRVRDELPPQQAHSVDEHPQEEPMMS